MIMSTAPLPIAKLATTALVAVLLALPLFMVWLLIYDRQAESRTAQASISEGWGGPQVLAGPLLVVPYRATVEETVSVDGQPTTRLSERWEQRTIAPEAVEMATDLTPERRSRSIYEAIVYAAAVEGRARFTLPADVARSGMDPARLDLARAELRFGLSDPRGLGTNPRVAAGAGLLRLEPGGGTGATGGAGFFAALDATELRDRPIEIRFAFDFRGNRSLALAPQAGDTKWTVRSQWPHPSFGGAFLPTDRAVRDGGFAASYRVGNLALGRTLVSGGAAPAVAPPPGPGREDAAATGIAQIELIEPVDLYSQVDRAAKYGFLFIGFTFLAFLLFDIVGGVRVGPGEYLLVGAGLVLFFVMLLAFAEVIGFAGAYLLAASAITGLIASYSAAVLKGRRRAGFITGLLAALYGALYLLLSLEAYSLLIGSLLLFAALAATMYLTRNLSWGRSGDEIEAAA
jgi:inner membrane protein